MGGGAAEAPGAAGREREGATEAGQGAGGEEQGAGGLNAQAGSERPDSEGPAEGVQRAASRAASLRPGGSRLDQQRRVGLQSAKREAVFVCCRNAAHLTIVLCLDTVLLSQNVPSFNLYPRFTILRPFACTRLMPCLAIHS